MDFWTKSGQICPSDQYLNLFDSPSHCLSLTRYITLSQPKKTTRTISYDTRRCCMTEYDVMRWHTMDKLRIPAVVEPKNPELSKRRKR